jgi:RHS repeat-associated protein
MDCCNIGPLRRHAANDQCCWPKAIRINGTPIPDYVPPQPEWFRGDPDDLNDAPYWPTLDIELMEDSPEAPVRYFNGELQLRSKDLGSDGFGIPWGHTRIYSNRLSNSFDFGNGHNWLVLEWPQLVRRKTDPALVSLTHPFTKSKPTGCTLVLLRGTRNALWFDEFSTGDDCETEWKARFGAKHLLSFDAGTKSFRLEAPNGHLWVFNAFTPNCFETSNATLYKVRDARLDGKLVRHVGPGGQTINITYSNGKVQTVSRSTESFAYNYYESGENCGRLHTVTHLHERQAVRRAEYLYCEQGGAFGQSGDLKLVAVQIPGAQGGWRNKDIEYYRYQKTGLDTYCQGLLTHALGAEAFRRLYGKVTDEDGFPGSELTRIADSSVLQLASFADRTSDSTLAQYADLFVTYHTDPSRARRVHSVTMDGGGRVHRFEDYQITSYNKCRDYNILKVTTTEIRNDGNQVKVYSNSVGQLKLYELTQLVQGSALTNDGGISPSTSAGRWMHYRKYYPDRPSLFQTFEPSAIRHEAGSPDVRGDPLVFFLSGLVHEFDYQVYTKLGAEYLSDVRVKKGSGANAPTDHLKHFDYIVGGNGVTNVRAVSRVTTYGVSNGPGIRDATVTFAYSWNGRAQILKKTTRLPGVPGLQHGPGEDHHPSTVEMFDPYGNQLTFRDVRNTLTASEYIIETGARRRMEVTFRDRDGQDRHAVTNFQSDLLGRVTAIFGPQHDAIVDPTVGRTVRLRRALWFNYRDIEKEVWTIEGYVIGRQEHSLNPLEISNYDRKGRLVRSIAASVPAITNRSNNWPSRSRWSRWQQHNFTNQGKHDWTRVYLRIPQSGSGAEGPNYNQTDFQYDPMYRCNWIESPGGTQTELAFEPRGLLTDVLIGGKQVEHRDYDDHNAYENDDGTPNPMPGTAGGNGVLTRVLRPDGSFNRATAFRYNYRDQQVRVRNTEGTSIRISYNNQNQSHTISQENASIPYVVGIEKLVDVCGRTYDTSYTVRMPPKKIVKNGKITWEPGGEIRKRLREFTWYNDSGDVIKHQPPGGFAFTKLEYDGLGREVRRSLGYDILENQRVIYGSPDTYRDAINVVGDTLLEQAESVFDDVGNLTEVSTRKRFPNVAGTGHLGDAISAASGRAKARVAYARAWYDPLGRELSVANYGTNGGQRLTAVYGVVPNSTDDILVTHTRYNDRGEADLLLDPLSRQTRLEFDHANRLTLKTENYVDGMVSLNTPDEDRTALFEYSPDGDVSSIRVPNPATGDQVTRYLYGVADGSHSQITTSMLLRQVIYPDGKSVEYGYNQQGEVARFADQNGSEHEFTYDPLGRLHKDTVLSFGTNVDSRIKQLRYRYDVMGRLRYIDSRDAAGKTVNQIQREFNERNQLVSEGQQHDNRPGMPLLGVGYGYADGTGNHLRLTDVIYPSSRQLLYLYSGAPFPAILNPQADLSVGRVVRIADRTLGSVSYSYYGAHDFHSVHYPQTAGVEKWLDKEVRFSLSELGDFEALDRFDRLSRVLWLKGKGGSHRDSFEYGYSRAGMRTFRRSLLKQHTLSEAYRYDGLDRLTQANRGDVPSSAADVSRGSETFAQQWTFDPTDNWREFRQDDNGGGGPTKTPWELIQSRQHNVINQISKIGGPGDKGAKWVTPQYDNAGNMVLVPQPNDPTQGYTCIYDAWNRLTGVWQQVAGAGGKVLQPVSIYDYDGLGRQITRHSYTDAALSASRHFYYNHDWQCLAEYVEGKPGEFRPDLRLEREYVWGIRGLDDLVLRDRDTNGDGRLDERLYGLNDGNLNLTALVDSTGAVQERYHYDPYGRPLFFDGGFLARPETALDSNRLYAGYHRDDALGLYHVRNRGYHPLLGVWLQLDPLRHWDGNNLYEYGRSAAVSYIDPTGEVVHIAVGAVVGAVIGGVVYGLTADEFSWSEFGLYVAAGGLSGGLASATFGASLALTGAAGYTATASGIIASTAAGAVGGASHGFVMRGGLTALHGGSLSESLQAGSLGAIEEGTTGAIGGLAGGYVFSRVGAGLFGSALSGVTGGFASGAFSGGYRGLLDEGWHGAISGAVEGGLNGAVTGGFFGAGGYLAGRSQAVARNRIVRLQRLGRLLDWGGTQRLPRQVAAHLENPRHIPGEGRLLVRTDSRMARLSDRNWPIERQQARQFLARVFGRGRLNPHHRKPLSLGGSEREGNIIWYPRRVHLGRGNTHPTVPTRRKAPLGTLFF